MTGSPWSRARHGLPAGVLGRLAPPDDLVVIEARLDQGLSGLVPLAQELLRHTVSPLDTLGLPLAERLLTTDPLVRARPPLSVLPAGIVVILEGAEAASPDWVDRIRTWWSGRCPLVLQASVSCPLLDRLGEHQGPESVSEIGVSAPRTLDVDTLELVLVAAGDAVLTVPDVAEALGCTRLRALARLEHARSSSPLVLQADGTYRFEPAWIVEQLRRLPGPVLQQLGQHAPPRPEPTWAEARVLGDLEAALAAASTPTERAIASWELERPFDALDGIPPRIAANLWWEVGEPEALRALELPEADRADVLALVNARWGPEAPETRTPAVQALLPLYHPTSPIPPAVRALETLHGAAASPGARGRIAELAGRLSFRAGNAAAAARWFGAALPDLHQATAWLRLARSVAGLVSSLDDPPAADLMGWLEVAMLENVGDAEALAWCRVALEGLEASLEVDATDQVTQLRRLGMQLSSLQRDLPTVRVDDL